MIAYNHLLSQSKKRDRMLVLPCSSPDDWSTRGARIDAKSEQSVTSPGYPLCMTRYQSFESSDPGEIVNKNSSVVIGGDSSVFQPLAANTDPLLPRQKFNPVKRNLKPCLDIPISQGFDQHAQVCNALVIHHTWRSVFVYRAIDG